MFLAQASLSYRKRKILGALPIHKRPTTYWQYRVDFAQFDGQQPEQPIGKLAAQSRTALRGDFIEKNLLALPQSDGERKARKLNMDNPKFAPVLGSQLKPHMELWAIVMEERDLPRSSLPEIALCGRSNSGKSNLINALIGQNKANVSKRPGSTESLQFWKIGRPARLALVDLPGYGFANTSESTRVQVSEFFLWYLKSRANLRMTLLVIEARLGLRDAERQILNFFRRHRIRFRVILSKCDELPKKLLMRRIDLVQSELKQAYSTPHSHIFPVSARFSSNLDSLRKLLTQFQVGKSVMKNEAMVKVYDLMEVKRLKRLERLNRKKELQSEVPLQAEQVRQALSEVGVTGDTYDVQYIEKPETSKYWEMGSSTRDLLFPCIEAETYMSRFFTNICELHDSSLDEVDANLAEMLNSAAGGESSFPFETFKNRDSSTESDGSLHVLGSFPELNNLLPQASPRAMPARPKVSREVLPKTGPTKRHLEFFVHPKNWKSPEESTSTLPEPESGMRLKKENLQVENKEAYFARDEDYTSAEMTKAIRRPVSYVQRNKHADLIQAPFRGKDVSKRKRPFFQDLKAGFTEIRDITSYDLTAAQRRLMQAKLAGQTKDLSAQMLGETVEEQAIAGRTRQYRMRRQSLPWGAFIGRKNPEFVPRGLGKWSVMGKPRSHRARHRPGVSLVEKMRVSDKPDRASKPVLTSKQAKTQWMEWAVKTSKTAKGRELLEKEG